MHRPLPILLFIFGLLAVVIGSVSLSAINNIKLKPITNGAISGPEVLSGKLFSNPGTIVFAVRRPG